jgi:hypothetical protein
MFRDLRRFGYAVTALEGLLLAAAPSLALAVGRRLLALSFEGTDDLTARPWYRTQTRATGVGLLAAGLTGLALEGAGDDADAPADDDARPPADAADAVDASDASDADVAGD